MPISQRTKRYFDMIAIIVRAYLPDAKVILYGSRARGDEREGSDIDIALDISEKIPSKIFNSIYFDIEESDLPIKYDLVDLSTVSETMKKEILKDGVIWQK